MKNKKSDENKALNDSSKTSGGISKSFLSPCRRVGLSRKWKSGSSPFISPLTQNTNSENKTSGNPTHNEKSTKRLRYDVTELENGDTGLKNFENNTENNEDIVSTPIKESLFSRRKKSKLNSLSSNTYIAKDEEAIDDSPTEKSNNGNLDCESNTNHSFIQECNSKVQLPGHSIAISNFSESALTRSASVDKKCVVLIEEQFLHTESCNNTVESHVKNDVDDIPLSRIKKINKNKSLNELGNCNDFCDKNLILHVKKLKDKNTSAGDFSRNKRKNRKEKMEPFITSTVDDKFSLQKSNAINDDDDDFEVDNKKTILIKKTYKTKLSQAKSEAITQKDIDELKARIEAKRDLLIAKTNKKEFEELRILTEHWQKACQEALTELLTLTKEKIPDKQSFTYSELLKTLNIPHSLAGYDEENDCFVNTNGINFLSDA